MTGRVTHLHQLAVLLRPLTPHSGMGNQFRLAENENIFIGPTTVKPGVMIRLGSIRASKLALDKLSRLSAHQRSFWPTPQRVGYSTDLTLYFLNLLIDPDVYHTLYLLHTSHSPCRVQQVL